MKRTLSIAAKIVVYGTCLFLLPFWFLAYFDPMAAMNLSSIGLVPSEASQVLGLSNIRGSVGGLRLAIIGISFIGTFYKKPDMSLSAAILVGAVSLGRFLSLGLDGWEMTSFGTAVYELVIVLSLLYLGGFLTKSKTT